MHSLLVRLVPIAMRTLVVLALVGGLGDAQGASAQATSGLFDVLVSSSQTNSVKRFDGETGAYLGDFVAPGSGGLQLTQEVLFDLDGNLLVTGFGTPSILKYDGRTGEFLGAFSSGYSLRNATKMVYGPDGDLYVSQWAGSSSVARFDGQTGAFVEEVTPSLDRPMQPAWSDDGTLHVVNFGTLDVRRFSPTGTSLGTLTIGAPLTGPVNQWFRDDMLYVLDWRGGTVERYDPDTGEHIDTFITGLTRAEGWAYGPDGRLYIADWQNGRVNAYDADTGALDEVLISSGGLQEANSVVFFERRPDFSLSLSSESVQIVRGSSGTVEVALGLDRDLPFDAPVALRCGNVPSHVTCTFAEGQLTPGATGAGTTLTLHAGAPSQAATILGRSGPLGPAGTVALALVLVAGLVTHLLPRPRTTARHVRRTAALVSVGGALALAGACDDPIGPPDLKETVAVEVFAEGDGLQRSAIVALIIDP